MSSNSHPSKPKSLVPLGPLAAVLVLALGGAGLLIPRKSELVKRLVEDGQHDRALALVSQSVNGDDAPTIEPTASNLVQILLDSSESHFDEAANIRIDSLVRITNDPDGVRKVLLDRRRILPKDLLPKLLDHLAVRAVHTNNPELAVSIYEDLKSIQPLSLEQTTQHVAAARFSGHPKKALESVSSYLTENRIPFTQLPEELRMTTIALHREVNEGTKAFDLLSEQFKTNMDPQHRHELIELISTVAAQSGRVNDSLPILENYLANTAAGKSEWRSLTGNRTTDPSDEDFLKFGKLLAQHLEWNGQIDKSFEIYRKLAAMGDLTSLDRCVTIYPWIDRENDLTDLLQAVAPVEGRERYTLLLGRLQIQRGKFQIAESIYRKAIAGNHSEDSEIWVELAIILDAGNQYKEALEAYRTALKWNPELHEIRVRIARLHVTLGDYPNALAAYRKIPAESHTRKSREDYSMIAKSLDAKEDLVRAVRLKTEAVLKPTPGSILDIADAKETAGEMEAMEETLQDGVQAFPKSKTILIRLADHLSKESLRNEAFQLLSRSKFIGDKRISSRILSLGVQLERNDETLGLIRNLKEEWSPSEHLDLAALYEGTNEISSALSHYLKSGSIEGNTEAIRIKAEIAFQQGNLSDAARMQADYLDITPHPDFEGWTFLGDIYRMQGNSTRADISYKRALDYLKASLASDDNLVQSAQ